MKRAYNSPTLGNGEDMATNPYWIRPFSNMRTEEIVEDATLQACVLEVSGSDSLFSG
jgi:hypothetical protein